MSREACEWDGCIRVPGRFPKTHSQRLAEKDGGLGRRFDGRHIESTRRSLLARSTHTRGQIAEWIVVCAQTLLSPSLVCDKARGSSAFTCNRSSIMTTEPNIFAPLYSLHVLSAAISRFLIKDIRQSRTALRSLLDHLRKPFRPSLSHAGRD